MRIFEIQLNKALALLNESVETDFYDMYLLLTVQHDDSEVQSLLTDRVDRLIEHFRNMLYRAFIIRTDAVLPTIARPDVFDQFLNIKNPHEMLLIIDDIVMSGRIYPNALGLDNNEPTYEYGTYAINDGAWVAVVQKFREFCNPPNNARAKAELLDELFGLAHNNGSLTDYLEDTRENEWGISKPWLFDALYVRALAHPNELAQRASYDARQAAKSADIGYGFGSSLSNYTPVSDADKLKLYKAKKERGADSRPYFQPAPNWLGKNN